MKTKLPSHSVADDVASEGVVTHDDIMLRARELWEELGRPEGEDLAIWLEAEAQLLAIQHKVYRYPSLHSDR